MKQEQKKLITEIMNEDQKDGLYNQSSVEWLVEQVNSDHYQKAFGKTYISIELIEQAKQMEKQQRLIDYNVGYNDASRNHINDAENYVNQQTTH